MADNSSTDRARDVLEDFSRRYPVRLRYILESRHGLRYARNTGIRKALGRHPGFRADDVTVDSKWSQNLTAALHDGKWAGAVGYIVAAHDFSRPRWLSLEGPYNNGGMLTLFGSGESAGELQEPPFNANTAFRKKMFERHSDFRTDLKRWPGTMTCKRIPSSVVC